VENTEKGALFGSFFYKTGHILFLTKLEGKDYVFAFIPLLETKSIFFSVIFDHQNQKILEPHFGGFKFYKFEVFFWVIFDRFFREIPEFLPIFDIFR
jgi:hypothetical protein